MKDDTKKRPETGKLRIGDDWNAIRIIASSQSNPLKAIAEFVENSIDARARTITLTRGRENNEHYLSIKDDGEGVPRNEDGIPDFKYVATHICDSIKRTLKADGNGLGLQGEFGIGLLSFWTVGGRLTMTSTGADQRAYQMTMNNGDPRYAVSQRRTLFADGGTELRIAPLLEGLRSLTGEKIQWYLAAELRDRIREAGVRITVIDKVARKQFEVEPRLYQGRLLRKLPPIRCEFGEAYAELYFCDPSDGARVSLTRMGTRVLENLCVLPDLEVPPWNSKFVEGVIDAPFLTLTPGTRNGIIPDDRYAAFLAALGPLTLHLNALIEEQKRAEEEQASQQSLKTIQKAFHEAMLALPREEYNWFEIQADGRTEGQRMDADGVSIGAPGELQSAALVDQETQSDPSPQRQFFEFAGPLFSVVTSPTSCAVPLGKSRPFRALARDRSRRRVVDELHFSWTILEGDGTLEGACDQEVVFHAPAGPGLVRLAVTVTQRDLSLTAQSMITVANPSDIAPPSTARKSQGLPNYTFERAAGELWRSRFDSGKNLIVVNSGHRDFVFATRHRALQLRYLVRLYVKELVLRNFSGAPADQLLERAIELSLYAEEKLRN